MSAQKHLDTACGDQDLDGQRCSAGRTHARPPYLTSDEKAFAPLSKQCSGAAAAHFWTWALDPKFAARARPRTLLRSKAVSALLLVDCKRSLSVILYLSSP